jgi:chaperonin GroEL
MDKAVEVVVSELDKQSVKVGDKVQQIATISANGDENIGKLIADAFEKVGKDGVITVEESKGIETSMEIVDGMQFDKGFLSTHFATNQEKMIAEIENPYILLYDGRISNMNDILKLLEGVAQSSKPLVIIADDVEGEVLGTLVVNKLRGALNVCAVKAPAFGDRKKEMMKDIATVTGGTFIQPEIGQKLEDVTMDMLGVAEKIVVGKDNTTIINGAGSSDEIGERVNAIKTQIEESKSDYEREKMQERLAKLAGGVAVLYIGAGSEVELKEKKDRVDDALQATKSAIEEGVVEGGGIALLRTIKSLNGLETEDAWETDGVEVIREALSAPIIQILENAGQDYTTVLEKLFEDSKIGYNARTEKFVDMFADGVIDPKKVTRCAIQNASSVVGMILTTECMIVNKPNTEEKVAQKQMLMG